MKWNYYNKYKSHKTNANGVIFDSKKEYNRYIELTLLSRSGAIKGLKRQVKFELIPAQYEPDIISPRGKVKKGKLIERAVSYIANFSVLLILRLISFLFLLQFFAFCVFNKLL